MAGIKRITEVPVSLRQALDNDMKLVRRWTRLYRDALKKGQKDMEARMTAWREFRREYRKVKGRWVEKS